MLRDKSKGIKLIIVFSLITAICIFAIYEAIYTQIYKKQVEEVTAKQTEETSENNFEELEQDFNKIFDNKFTNNDNVENIEKVDSNKELVYTDYYKKDSGEDFEIDVTIPKINIKEAKSINNKINSIFIKKAESIQHNEQENKTIYTINYTAQLKNNILSIIIDSTLKEKNFPQRRIIATYNFNIETKKEVGLEELIEKKNLSKEDVENKIKEKIRKRNTESENLENMGYEVYKRDLRSEMYDIENIENFYYDGNENLYIIFAYGNSESTSEKDIVIF